MKWQGPGGNQFAHPKGGKEERRERGLFQLKTKNEVKNLSFI